MLDDHDSTGNEILGYKIRPSGCTATLGGQVHINIVDLPTIEIRSEIQRDEYAATSPHRVVSSRRALLKEKLRMIEAEQVRQEQEIERRLEAKQREFDEAMHQIEERRRQIEEETASRLLQLQMRQKNAKKNVTNVCKSTSTAQSKRHQSSCTSPPPQESNSTSTNSTAESVPESHYLPPVLALGTGEPLSSPQLPPGTGRRGRDDEFTQMDSQQQSSRNELPLAKGILQDPFLVISSHTSLTFPGRSEGEETLSRRQNTSTKQTVKVHFLQPCSVQHVFETLRTSSYSSGYLQQQHFFGTLRKLPFGAEFCNWTSLAKIQIHLSRAINDRLSEQTPPNVAGSTSRHHDTNLRTLLPIAFDDTGQHRFVIVLRYRNEPYTNVGLRLYWLYTWDLITRTDSLKNERLEQVIGLRSEDKQHSYSAFRNQVIPIFRSWVKHYMGRLRRSAIGSGERRKGRRANCSLDIAAKSTTNRALLDVPSTSKGKIQSLRAARLQLGMQYMDVSVTLVPGEQGSGDFALFEHRTTWQYTNAFQWSTLGTKWTAGGSARCDGDFPESSNLAVLDVLGDSKPELATLSTLRYTGGGMLRRSPP